MRRTLVQAALLLVTLSLATWPILSTVSAQVPMGPPGGMLYIPPGGASGSLTGTLTTPHLPYATGASTLADSPLIYSGSSLQVLSTGTGTHSTFRVPVISPTGVDNTVIGEGAGAALTSGAGNMAYGYHALAALQGGSDNIAIGWSAGDALTSGTTNVAVGSAALGASQTGQSNVALGMLASTNSTGNLNVAVGYAAAAGATTADRYVAVGYEALYAGTTGAHGTAVGWNSLHTSNADNNTAIGYDSAGAVTSGANNTAVGASTLEANTTGSGYVAIGYKAGSWATAGNEFYLNNVAQDDLAGDKAYSLLYGTFAGVKGTTSGNVLHVNGELDVNACKVLTGTGDPEGVVTAPVCSLFLRTNGGAGTTLYVKETGAGNTGWAGK